MGRWGEEASRPGLLPCSRGACGQEAWDISRQEATGDLGQGLHELGSWDSRPGFKPQLCH